MAGERQRYALQTIFSFFLGLMVTAFIGVGVYTFYPQPEQAYNDQIQKLSRQQEPLNMKNNATWTQAERDEYTRINQQIDELNKQQQKAREIWGRNTSIVLITFATIVMSVSLIRSEQLRVISNGLLLGGLFTMVYGTGWIIASGTSVARFLVMTAALLITLALGYLKFVRERAASTAPATATVIEGETPVAGIAALEARVASLEARATAAAAALGAASASQEE